jgi:hypothetical protein
MADQKWRTVFVRLKPNAVTPTFYDCIFQPDRGVQIPLGTWPQANTDAWLRGACSALLNDPNASQWCGPENVVKFWLSPGNTLTGQIEYFGVVGKVAANGLAAAGRPPRQPWTSVLEH